MLIPWVWNTELGQKVPRSSTFNEKMCNFVRCIERKQVLLYECEYCKQAL